jgi:mannose-6-phosphate isomerase
MELYPLKFDPILKSVLWGGQKICQFKRLDCLLSDIGESWELSNMPGAVSVVSNGYLKGTSLSDIMEAQGEALVGRSVYARFGKSFPLLIKFIDAESDLSIQVHPNDEMAAKRHHCFGKTEMWYILDAKPGSKLISGFLRDMTSEEYSRRIEDNSIEEVLNAIEPSIGDVFFIPSGRVHALGAGVFVAEIQQSSDITYRLYDYNRKDANGQLRELHTELAKSTLQYRNNETGLIPYEHEANGVSSLISCTYFTTNHIHIKDSRDGLEIDRDYSALDSFVIYICMKGEGAVSIGDQTISMRQGETLLLPSTVEGALLHSMVEFLLLETYILPE